MQGSNFNIEAKPLFLKTIGSGAKYSIANESDSKPNWWDLNQENDLKLPSTAAAAGPPPSMISSPKIASCDAQKDIQNFFSNFDLQKLKVKLEALSKIVSGSNPRDLTNLDLAISTFISNQLDGPKRIHCLHTLHAHVLGYRSSDDYESTPRPLSTATHLDKMKKNSIDLIEKNVFKTLYKSLRILMSMVLYPLENAKPENVVKDLISLQVDMILDILWTMLVFGADSQAFVQEICDTNPFMIVFLFDSLEKLAESTHMQLFSLRKLTLLLCKTVSITVGGLDGLDSVKEEVWNTTVDQWHSMKNSGDKKPKPIHEKEKCNQVVKCNLQDIVDYRHLIMNRYPSYNLPNPDLDGYTALSPHPSVEKQCKQYFSFAPIDWTWPAHALLESSRYATFDPPYSSKTIPPPIALKEGDEIMKKYYKPSSSILQIAMETRLRNMSDNLVGIFGTEASLKHQNYLKSSNFCPILKSSPRMIQIRQFYDALYPRLSSHITMLVRLLFYLNVSTASAFDHAAVNESLDKDINTLSPSERLIEIGKRDTLRHKEIITNAISQLVLYTIKAAKRYNVLAFEHVCLLLVDNSAPILILKMLSSWFANPSLLKGKKAVMEDADTEDVTIGTAWLTERNLPKELDFFHIVQNGQDIPLQSCTIQQIPSDLLVAKRAISQRNASTTIYLVSVLHKLTKNKPIRIQAMVQWKAQAVLKRMLKSQSQELVLPVLKILKSQIPYLGKKWRANNMPIISNIFMTVKHRLKEEYLCGEGDSDSLDAQLHDQELRDLVSFYNGHTFDHVAATAQNTQILNEMISSLERPVSEYDGTDDFPDDSTCDNSKWIDGIIVDEMTVHDDSVETIVEYDDEVDKIFHSPGFNMDLLEEDKLMTSFEMFSQDEFDSIEDYNSYLI